MCVVCGFVDSGCQCRGGRVLFGFALNLVCGFVDSGYQCKGRRVLFGFALNLKVDER